MAIRAGHIGESPLPGKGGTAYAGRMETPAVPRAAATAAAVPAAGEGRAAALILAAGEGQRAGGERPKQYQPLAGKPLLRWSVEAFLCHPGIGAVHVVVAAGAEEMAQQALFGLAVPITRGGASRQQSVRAGLAALAAAAPERVLIHDAARPLVPAALIDRVLAGLDGAVGVCPALPVVDSLRRGREGQDGEWIEAEVDRRQLWRAQTPQGFDFARILAAHERAAASPENATDDAQVLRAAGHEVRLVAGDERAMKVTSPGDFELAGRQLPWSTVSASGFDVHRFGAGDHLWLCGVAIPHHHGLIGHSDADAGLHALTDALLGTIGAGDIGQHFPPSDPRFEGASSDRFLAHAAQLVEAAGGRILHCDVTLIAEAPKIGPHREAMRARLAAILGRHRPRISIKATTTEKLGFVGRGEGIAAQALATVRLPDWDDR